ncbi:MAG: VacJ family lipoprotein [Roseococcus sp.]|nr:VacJ family lipoprotein [Roseococcus sp.]
MKLPLRPPLLLLGAALAACAGPGGTDPTDPFEATNRQVLEFNEGVDRAVIRPLAEAYRDHVPAPVRTGIRNLVNNLNEPVVLANTLLQLRFLDAGHTLMRFYLNSTAGLLGLVDIATPAGIERRTGDFGQTLAAYGVPDGPFLMLPLLGPSNLRDAIGDGVDSIANPVGLLSGHVLRPVTGHLFGAGRGALGGLTLRADNIETLDALRAESLDFYARLRSVVQQRRDAQLGRSSDRGEGLVTLDDPAAPSAGAGGPAPAAALVAPGPAERAITGQAPGLVEITRAWAQEVLRRADPGAPR